MKKTYVVSRYASDTKAGIKFNIQVARYAASLVIDCGELPIVPHLYFTQFLNDSIEEERETGMQIGNDLLILSDQALVVIVDGVISSGMEREIKQLKALGKPYKIINFTRRQIELKILTFYRCAEWP